MQITRCNTLAELNELASNLLIDDLRDNAQSLICAATGNSPTGVYKKWVERQMSMVVNGLTFIKLDEWYGLGPDDEGSCEKYLHENLLGPLGIDPEKYTGFDGRAGDATAECKRIKDHLDAHGPIDICILGLGKNGHIAFNEPAGNLQPHAHLATLSATSLEHTMVMDTKAEIKYGFTLGMADILQSRKIILVVNGTHKNEVMKRLMEQKISADLPASFLWLHPDVHCFYCDNDN
jgi:galactosamine-6-phosphate isomerase